MTDIQVGNADERTPAEASESSVPLLRRGPRLALAVFAIVEVIAIPFFLRAGEKQWFFLDEFDFLATRSLSDPVDLLRPHYEHWTTLPIVAYRGLWALFGLNTYVPYQLLAIVSHLAVAALLRVLMRRVGVGPWIATLAASAVVLFGVGQENIIWGFQITFTWSLLFGLLQLLASDHDGRIDRRDWLALVAGLAAIMSAGPGLVMVGVVGLALFLRGRWRAALFQTIPLLVIYGLWSLRFRDSTSFESVGPPGPRLFASFVWRGLSVAFDGMGQVQLVGWILALVIVAGLLVAWRSDGTVALLRKWAVPLALACGAPVFLMVTAWGRAEFYGVERASESRYLYMVAAMVAPLLAVTAQSLTDRWRVLAPIVVLLFLVGIPGNLAAADDRAALLRGDKNFVLTLPTVEAAADAPYDAEPQGQLLKDARIGWLRDGVRDGKVPAPEVVRRSVLARARVSLALLQTHDAPPDMTCRQIDSPIAVKLRPGDRLGFSGVLRVSDATLAPPIQGGIWNAFNGSTLLVRATPPPLQLESDNPRAPATVCGLPAGT